MNHRIAIFLSVFFALTLNLLTQRQALANSTVDDNWINASAVVACGLVAEPKDGTCFFERWACIAEFKKSVENFGKIYCDEGGGIHCSQVSEGVYKVTSSGMALLDNEIWNFSKKEVSKVLYQCLVDANKSVCGNGKKEGAEICDAGADNGKPGVCNSTCTGGNFPEAAKCGNGVIENAEMCDDGAENGKALKCSLDCKSHDLGAPAMVACGNQIVEAGEECDDGNQDDRDGCTTQCRKEAVTGGNIATSNDPSVSDGKIVAAPSGASSASGCVLTGGTTDTDGYSWALALLGLVPLLRARKEQ